MLQHGGTSRYSSCRSSLAPLHLRLSNRSISLGARLLPRGPGTVAEYKGSRSARGLHQHAPCSRLGMQSQYPLDLVCLSIESARRTPLRRVPPLLTIVRCRGWPKFRGWPRERAWERFPLEAPVAFRLSPGQALTIG